jgi:hypothetical protein
MAAEGRLRHHAWAPIEVTQTCPQFALNFVEEVLDR